MKQEDKDLLLKDLCARLPYGIRGKYIDKFYKEGMPFDPLVDNILISYKNPFSLLNGTIKPYLFPLSSITEEQYNSLYESGILDNCSHNYEYVNPHIYGVSFIFKQFKTYSLELIEWLNKNHFDYRGLISMGLAIDCTNLNIY
jgi:hypothetical protein